MLSTPSPTQANYLAGVNPSSASLAVVEGSNPVLEFDYYDWGEDWSGVKRQTQTTEEGTEARFTMNNVLERGDAPFKIEGTWSQSAPDTLRFKATLVPE